jgi:hypothetical protein
MVLSGKLLPQHQRPNPVVRPANRRLVVCKVAAPTWSQQLENEYLESRQECKVLTEKETCGDTVITGNLLYQGFR